MTLSLIRAYGGGRVDAYPPQPTDEDDDDDDREDIDRCYEWPPDDWAPLDLSLPHGWRPRDWPLCPIRFVDGKDEGEIVTCPKSPQGHPVPVRLSEIGAIVMRIQDGECKREFVVTERVVSMVGTVFPWHEVEAFGVGLQEAGLRLLIAKPPGSRPSYDYEKMRKAAQNRSLDEMGVLEKAAIAGAPDVPTVIDGRLEPRVGGFDPACSPIFGVIKTHRENYLHPLGMQVLYSLEPGQRTPAFALLKGKGENGIAGHGEGRRLSVVSWYLRLSGGSGSMPSWGYVRIEAPLRWFEEQQGQDFDILDRLSEIVFRYRCRQRSYGRAPVSLHPIVRGEESLGALFRPFGALRSGFFRLNGI